jgi:arginine/lysine/ornithine decarboxylase
MEIHEAEEAPHIRLLLTEAIGHTSAATINLYPPGIPLVVPGEEIDAHLVEVVTQCIAHGLEVEGLEIEEQVTFVDVVD